MKKNTDGVRALRKPVNWGRVGPAILVVAILGGLAWWAASSPGTGSPDGTGTPDRAVAPLTDAQVSSIYGSEGDPEYRDGQGTPVFSFTKEGPDGSPDYESFSKKEERAEAFAKYAAVREAVARMGNALVLAVLDPAADQGFIKALDAVPGPSADVSASMDPGGGGTLGEYLPSEELRGKFSGITYGSFRMSMAHNIRQDGSLSVIGTVDVSGTLSCDGQRRPFQFYTDYTTDKDGKLVSLSGFRLAVEGSPVTAEMLSLP